MNQFNRTLVELITDIAISTIKQMILIHLTFSELSSEVETFSKNQSQEDKITRGDKEGINQMHNRSI